MYLCNMQQAAHCLFLKQKSILRAALNVENQEQMEGIYIELSRVLFQLMLPSPYRDDGWPSSTLMIINQERPRTGDGQKWLCKRKAMHT